MCSTIPGKIGEIAEGRFKVKTPVILYGTRQYYEQDIAFPLTHKYGNEKIIWALFGSPLGADGVTNGLTNEDKEFSKCLSAIKIRLVVFKSYWEAIKYSVARDRNNPRVEKFEVASKKNGGDLLFTSVYHLENYFHHRDVDFDVGILTSKDEATGQLHSFCFHSSFAAFPQRRAGDSKPITLFFFSNIREWSGREQRYNFYKQVFSEIEPESTIPWNDKETSKLITKSNKLMWMIYPLRRVVSMIWPWMRDFAIEKLLLIPK